MTENTNEKKSCGCGCACDRLGKLKWLPHNWIGLKAIAVINLVLFYIMFLLTVGQFFYYWYIAFTFEGPLPYGIALRESFGNAIQGFLIAVFFLMIAKALKVLLKIKRAVIEK